MYRPFIHLVLGSLCLGTLSLAGCDGADPAVASIASEVTITPKFDWAMEVRAHKARAAYDASTGKYDPHYINPGAWKVAFNACASTAGPGDGIREYRWRFTGPNLDQRRVTTDCELPFETPLTQTRPPRDPCRNLGPNCNPEVPYTPPPITTFSPSFPATGAYNVELTVVTRHNGSRTINETIVLQDVVIVSVGDSMSAGEGLIDTPDQRARVLAMVRTVNTFAAENPVLEGLYYLSGLGWLGLQGGLLDNLFGDDGSYWDDRCHRSFLSPPAMSALMFDAAHPHLSVTFLSEACSGATTEQVMGWSQLGRNAPQLQDVRRHLCGGTLCAPEQRRPVDYVLFSAGINDLDFSGLLSSCASPIGSCDPGAASAADRAKLPRRYDMLAEQIALHLDPRDVFVWEYPINMLVEDSDEIFDGCGAFSGINSSEARDLFEDVGQPLNAMLAAAAGRHGWHHIGDVVDAFWGSSPGRCHGYCCEDPWFLHYSESVDNQGDRDGAVHPNGEGAGQLALLMVDRLSRIHDNRATPPSVSLVRSGCQSGKDVWTARTTASGAIPGVVSNVSYRLDSGAWTPLVGTTIKAASRQTVGLRARSCVVGGACSEYVTKSVRADACIPSAPTVRVEYLGCRNGSASYHSSVTARGPVEADTIKKEYSVANGPWRTLSATTPIRVGQNQSVSVRASSCNVNGCSSYGSGYYRGMPCSGNVSAP